MRVPALIPYLKPVALKPTSLSITAFISVIYAAIFIASVVIHETVPSPPAKSDQRGLDLDQAWSDLQEITRVPHPYNSHANSRVRNYLLGRLQGIASSYNGVELYDDLISNGTYAGSGPQIVYFEGENILVKIDGQDTSLAAVLFSAHFDSVSTGLGATDDGMGVVTLVQLVEYYASHKPKRTVVFNINNGEEDWLNGAHAFLDHPWSRLPTTFLNLEGAGNGGRPMLFRTSSFDVTSAFRSVSRPHGSTLSSDAFKRRLVRSGTDFSVYEEAGMRGLDLAFYRQRSRYHTKYDSVAWLGNKASLWLMMENALEAGNALASRTVETTKATDAVYFDIFGRAMVVVSQGGMLTLNVILLLIGPVTIGVIIVTAPSGYKDALGKLGSSKLAWVHGPVALVACLATTLGLAAIFAAVNTYIVYSSAYIIAISLISIAIISLAVSSQILSKYFLTHDPLQTTINHAFFTLVWWLLLCWASGQLNVNAVGGFYYVTFAYAGQMIALVLSLGAMIILDSPRPPRNGISARDGDDPEPSDAEPTERTSLLPSSHGMGNGHSGVADDLSRCTWSLEILASLVFPCILASGTLLMLMTALSQTLADGNSPMTVYLGIGLMAVLIALPIAPVASQIHRSAVFFLVLVLFATSIYNLAAFPFSPVNPLKVYLQQSVNLATGENQVRLVTINPFTSIHKQIPNTGHVACAADQNRLGLTNCAWSGLTPNVTLDSRSPSDWVSFSAKRTSLRNATITLRGRNTRSCRIYSDTPIVSVYVQGGHWERHLGGSDSNTTGFSEVRLWSRTWDERFVVDLTWADGEENATHTGRVACEWAEGDGGRIPALDEVLTYLPPWAVVTKLADGLVEGKHAFVL
ncbi:hypothetical protein FRC08_008413 [Ceratobasidium sp. 394]|nr:hypothetical protein FRC08_008413 [Ceratobasidium sp. 394]